MTTIRSYTCNFCNEEYSDKCSFHDINEIIGLKWENKVYSGTPYDKTEIVEVLKEINKHDAENHLCKRCLEAIQRFIPHYLNQKECKTRIENAKYLLTSLGYTITQNDN